MYRKRESKDLDRLNQVTCERDTYKKEFESKLLLIKELNEKIESLTNEVCNLGSFKVLYIFLSVIITRWLGRDLS